MSTKRDAVPVEPPPLSTLSSAGVDRLLVRLARRHGDQCRSDIPPAGAYSAPPQRAPAAPQPSLEAAQHLAIAKGFRIRVEGEDSSEDDTVFTLISPDGRPCDRNAPRRLTGRDRYRN